MKRFIIFGLMVFLTVLAACSRSKTTDTRVMSERERDSTIAKSNLPGAGVVGRALAEADSARARADRPLPP